VPGCNPHRSSASLAVMTDESGGTTPPHTSDLVVPRSSSNQVGSSEQERQFHVQLILRGQCQSIRRCCIHFRIPQTVCIPQFLLGNRCPHPAIQAHFDQFCTPQPKAHLALDSVHLVQGIPFQVFL